MEDGGSATRPRRPRQVCDNCRTRHSKCEWDRDDNESCRPCKSIGMTCRLQDSLRLRFDRRQQDLEGLEHIQWSSTRPVLGFCDETPHLNAFYAGKTPTYHMPEAEVFETESHSERPTASSTTSGGRLESPGYVTVRSTAHDLLHIDPSPPAKALTKEEAVLIRNYVLHMAAWADAHDPTRTFELELPRRALTEPILRHAICSFSARHMHRGIHLGETEAVAHQHECLKLLIPAMSKGEIIDESTLMAVAILRQNEEMDEYDHRFHLGGVSHILNLVPSFAIAGGLGEAAAWLCLREDIYISLTTQSPIKTNLIPFHQSTSITRGDDASWASLMVLHLASLLKRIYSTATATSSNIDLTPSATEISNWNTSKPPSYNPIHTIPRDPSGTNHPFPEPWHLAPHHAIGMQYFHIAQILLHQHHHLHQNSPTPTPLTPYTLSLRSRTADRNIRHHLRHVVGIAISNDPRVENTWFTARHCLAVWGGTYLRSGEDRRAALEFLARMEERTGWTTGFLVRSLREEWDGEQGHG